MIIIIIIEEYNYYNISYIIDIVLLITIIIHIKSCVKNYAHDQWVVLLIREEKKEIERERERERETVDCVMK